VSVQGRLEATRVIKQKFPHVHIIMLTVSDDDHDLFTAIKNGADGYLLKTLEPQELYKMLNSLCCASRVGARPALKRMN
jgi:DNA-binding NarL/FixJ family response regulator